MKNKEFGLLGYPLAHSLSPFIHTQLLSMKGLNGTYQLMETALAALEEEYRETLIKLAGFNVTIPFKERILPLLNTCSERAALYGAVNTVKITDGAACGYNTDCLGFLRSLQLEGLSLQGRVLICGCGGVSRMFAFESALAGAAVTLGIRETSGEKALRLQRELKEKLHCDSDIVLLSEADGSYDFIINGTPVGMFPHGDACPVSDELITKAGAVFDAIYNPYETQLLQKAKAVGKPALNGLPMLVIQAAAAEELWNGFTFSEEELKRVIQVTGEELQSNG